MFLVEPRPDYPLFFERLEPRGQRVRRDAREPRLQIMKPQRTLAEQIPEHEQRSFFAYDIETIKQLYAEPDVAKELRRRAQSTAIGARHKERANIILLRLDGVGVEVVAARLKT